MLLSIIIPIYNVEPYVVRCINSCVNQNNVNPSDYEIIIVNDGSPDHSYELAKEALKNFKNKSFLNQKNLGLSSARNNGLKLARGKYIWFVDSDDWIEQDALKSIFPKLNSEIDLIQLNYQLVYENGNIKNVEEFRINGIISGKDQLLVKPLPAPAQFTIYKQSFLLNNNLKFVTGIYHEDSEFKPRALYLSKSICSVPNIVYNYYQRSCGSITSKFKFKNAIDILFVIKNLYEFSKNIPYKYKRIFCNLMCLNMNSLMNGLRELNCSERFKILDELKHNRKVLKYLMLSSRLTYCIEGYLIYISPKIFYKMYNLIIGNAKSNCAK